MSRVRIVGGDIESLKKLGRNETLSAKPRAEDTGCLSDPQGMLAAAWSRFEEIPDRESTIERARDLCKNHAVEGPEGKPVRFHADGEPDLDLILVCHPKPELVHGVDGEVMEVERYMVFARSQDTVRGKCFTCINADRKGQRARQHDCWKKKTWLDWVPFAFSWAHGIDDAENIAKEMRSAWQVTADQKYDDNARINWSQVTELPFSNDFMLNALVGQQNAWDSLSRDEATSEDSE